MKQDERKVVLRCAVYTRVSAARTPTSRHATWEEYSKRHRPGHGQCDPDRDRPLRVHRRRRAGSTIRVPLDPDVLASTPRDHPGRRRTEATPACHANKGASRFRQSLWSRSSLARRTLVRRQHEPRLACRPRGQERALDPDDSIPRFIPRFSLPRPRGSRDGRTPSAWVQHQAPDRAAGALVRAMDRLGTSGTDSDAGRNRRLIDSATIRARNSSSTLSFTNAKAWLSTLGLGLGNGILSAETGGRNQPQNARERSESGSQTVLRLANRRKLGGFLPTRKPPRFARTGWWAMQGSNLRPLPCEGSALPLS